MAKIKVVTTKEFKNEFKKTIESSNINILLGAGFSKGIVDTLGNIEKFMEAINQFDKDNKYAVIEAWLFWDFFLRTIYPLCKNIDDIRLLNQIEFIKQWKQILKNRESAVINKQANVFTTNYDIAIEYSFETTFTDYNDGFKGRMTPYFSTTNFNRIYFEKALFSNRSIEVPIFNLLKLHGSVSWKVEEDGNKRIIYNDYKKNIDYFYCKYTDFFELINKKIFNELKDNFMWIDMDSDLSFKDLDALIPTDADTIKQELIDFSKKFKENFMIINPTKQKFSDTLLDKNYYELMRIYCNELEKNNTVLVTFGFSFDDEHIEEMTKRALGNPSLTIIIFAFCKSDVKKYESKFNKYENVWIIRNQDPTDENIAVGITEIYLDLQSLNDNLNKLFGEE